jgi:mannose-1-phosphate guanylyltransferase
LITRLWPLSREQYPKQLLKLAGDHTMLQATALRLQALALDPGCQLMPPLLVGNEEYRFLMAQQMQEIGVEHAPILLEPCGTMTGSLTPNLSTRLRITSTACWSMSPVIVWSFCGTN